MGSKIAMSGILALSVAMLSSESFAASCRNTYVSNARIAQLIEADLGAGAAQYCTLNTRVGGSGDYIFGVVACRFPDNRYVIRTVRGRDNMFDIGADKCRVYLSED